MPVICPQASCGKDSNPRPRQQKYGKFPIGLVRVLRLKRAKLHTGVRNGSATLPTLVQVVLLRGDFLLLFVSIIKLVCEIALLALAGRFLLGLLAGQKKESNFFYKALEAISKPFVSAARFITPKAIIDRHVPFVAFLLLSFIWVVSLIEKVRICTQIGIALCK
jgi:hypothetical protein